MKLYDDDASTIVFISVIVIFIVGFTMGTITAREGYVRETIIKCVENQKECKVRYDFYQLSNVK